MFGKNYDMKKTYNTIEELRNAVKHLEGLGLDYELVALGTWEDKEEIPIFCGSGIEIDDFGYKWAEMVVDGNKMKAKPSKTETSQGRIEVYISD